MRWFALTVLMANLVLAAWYVAVVRPADRARQATLPSLPVVAEAEDLPTLTLLAELSPAERRRAGVRPRPEAPSPAPAKEKAVAQCLLVGPVPEKITALELGDRFRALDLDPDFRRFELVEGTSYWVYLPPFDTEAETRARLKALREADIDSFRITSGPLKGGISLGVFSEQANAEQAREALLAKGRGGILIKKMPRTRLEIWAGFRNPGILTDDDSWAALKQDYPYLSRRSVSCGAVASAAKLE